jgi:hypothetical protein
MKQCFFYWGGEKMPLLNAITIISFKKYNPDYKIILYKPTVDFSTPTWGTHEQKIKYTGEDYHYCIESLVDEIRYINLEDLGFSNQIHHSQKADILRQWLLLNEGGWWSDMDIVWIKSISEFQLEGNFDLGVCWRNGYHGSGIMYSRPNTNFYKIIFDNLKRSFSPSDYQSVGPNILNRLFPGINHIENTEENIKVHNFELYNFAPWDSNSFPLLYQNGIYEDVITDEVYGIHWYNGGSSSGVFLNSFNIDDIKNSEIIIYKIINSMVGIDEILTYVNNGKQV